MTASGPVMQVEEVSKTFESRAGFFNSRRVVRAVKSVSLDVARGEVFGLVGESGSGKTTLARLMAGLLVPSSGRVRFEGSDLQALSSTENRRARRSLQMIFQDPVSALDPRQTVFSALAEVLQVRGEGDPGSLRERIESALGRVDLRWEDAHRRPHELSGGQCQRVGIARALLSSPSVLIADEPVSHLDVSTQAGIVALLGRLREQLGLTVVLIAHDLSVVRQLADRIAVMLEGRIVEEAPAEAVFSRAGHPYTRALLEAVPRPGAIPRFPGGRVAGGARRTGAGCPFAPRCPAVQKQCLARCPDPVSLRTGHYVRCGRSMGSAGVIEPM